MLCRQVPGLWCWAQGGAPSLDEQAAQYGADSIAFVDDLPGILSKNSDRRLYALPSGEKHAQQLTEEAGCGEAAPWESASCCLQAVLCCFATAVHRLCAMAPDQKHAQQLTEETGCGEAPSGGLLLLGQPPLPAAERGSCNGEKCICGLPCPFGGSMPSSRQSRQLERHEALGGLCGSLGKGA